MTSRSSSRLRNVTPQAPFSTEKRSSAIASSIVCIGSMQVQRSLPFAWRQMSASQRL